MATTNDEVLYVYQAPVTIGTGETSSRTKNEVTEENEEKEKYLYLLNKNGHRRRLPPYVNFDDVKSTRVEWIYQCSKKIMSHSCYARDHIFPQCQVNLPELDKVVPNYDGLNEEEKKKVPETP